jgi:hypothetical protein
MTDPPAAEALAPLLNRDEQRKATLLQDPIFLLQIAFHKTDEDDNDQQETNWHTDRVFATAEEAQAFAQARNYDYGTRGRDWRVYSVPAVGILADLLNKPERAPAPAPNSGARPSPTGALILLETSKAVDAILDRCQYPMGAAGLVIAHQNLKTGIRAASPHPANAPAPADAVTEAALTLDSLAEDAFGPRWAQIDQGDRDEIIMERWLETIDSLRHAWHALRAALRARAGA